MKAIALAALCFLASLSLPSASAGEAGVCVGGSGVVVRNQPTNVDQYVFIHSPVAVDERFEVPTPVGTVIFQPRTGHGPDSSVSNDADKFESACCAEQRLEPTCLGSDQSVVVRI